jgi:hypothetical protein
VSSPRDPQCCYAADVTLCEKTVNYIVDTEAVFRRVVDVYGPNPSLHCKE